MGCLAVTIAVDSGAADVDDACHARRARGPSDLASAEDVGFPQFPVRPVGAGLTGLTGKNRREMDERSHALESGRQRTWIPQISLDGLHTGRCYVRSSPGQNADRLAPP